MGQRKGDGIYQRSGRWTGQAYLGGGKRCHIGTWDTRREALDEKRRLELEARQNPARGSETAAEFADRWLDAYNVTPSGKPRWSRTTLQNNTYALRAFKDRFGGYKLSRFPHPEARPWALRQPACNVKVVRAMFADALRDKLVSENPFADLGIEQSKERRQLQAITEDELDLLGDCALEAHGPYGAVARAVVVTLGTVGARPIALTHLRREDVDAKQGTIYLRHPGKNVAPRTVLLPPKAAEAIAAMPARLDSEWLFTTKTGKRLSKGSLYMLWDKVRPVFEMQLDPARRRELRDARNDGGPMELYELRHCAATTMRRRGADWEQIAWQLCQTDGGFQARTRYSHLTETDHLSGLRAIYGQNVAELRSVANG